MSPHGIAVPRIKIHHIRAKFCGDPTRNVRDIRNQKFVLRKKWAKIHQNHLRPATPNPPIMPNFIEIGEKTGEKRYKNFYTLQHFGSPVSCLSQRSPVWVVIRKA